MLRLFCNLDIFFYKFSLCNVIISQHPVFTVVSLRVFSWERVVCQSLLSGCFVLQSTVLYSMSQSFTTEVVLFHKIISSSVISYRYPVYRLVHKVQNWRSSAIPICIYNKITFTFHVCIKTAEIQIEVFLLTELWTNLYRTFLITCSQTSTY